MYKIKFFENRGSFVSSVPICMLFASFSCLILLSRCMMCNKRGESKCWTSDICCLAATIPGFVSCMVCRCQGSRERHASHRCWTEHCFPHVEKRQRKTSSNSWVSVPHGQQGHRKPLTQEDGLHTPSCAAAEGPLYLPSKNRHSNGVS